MNTIETGQQRGRPVLASDEILRIARQDAERAYGDLTGYRITILLQEDGWHIDYDLTEPFVGGGGPHYVIDAETGTILVKRYEQ